MKDAEQERIKRRLQWLLYEMRRSSGERRLRLERERRDLLIKQGEIVMDGCIADVTE